MSALALLGACALVLPLVGLGTRVPWGRLPELLTSEHARVALSLSLRTSLLSTAICVLLGMPLALLLARQWPGVRVARVLAVLPMTMPPVVAGIALLSTLGRRGLLGGVLEAAGLQVSFTTAAVVLAQVFVSMPFLVVTLEAALRSRDTQAEQTARVLGAGPWMVLRRVTLPLVAPALGRGVALALGRSLGEFGATIAFAGSKEGVTRTMPLAIYLERENDSGTSLALAVVLIALSFLVVGATSVNWGELRQHLAGGIRHDKGVVAELAEVPLAATALPKRIGSAEPTASPIGVAGSQPRGQELQLSCALQERDVDVELQLPAGHVLALVGPNGSGKSTVCQVAAGLLDAAGGQLSLGGRLLDGPGVFVPAGKRGVALLRQDPGVFTHMSVLENVAFGPRCQGFSRSQARERAQTELMAVGASHLAGRRGGELSGGQAARVALARALATSPRLLVLDEPMAALDVGARTQLRSLLARRVAQAGLTVLLVTHDVVDVAALADTVMVLDAGRVVESGPAAQVLTAPSSHFSASLTGLSVLPGVVEGDATAPRLRLETGMLLASRPGQADLPEPGPGAALVPPDAVALYPDGASAGSPRNCLPGTVSALERTGGLVTVSVALAGTALPGPMLRAAVTAGAVAELGLVPGSEVVCVVKAVQVRLVGRRPGTRGENTGVGQPQEQEI
ncbi:molybdate ABC transporter permease subunit [Actinomyces bovis]|uniref:molybdate ABC transporter permease subunit n=1 Tax=Actinomyces bovis TaxID=1658 RepID=UPI000DD0B38F|nr:molybdate ABC transporter permease subunit [Actinomyces bovis]